MTIRVLVVDDSAFARKVLREVLSTDLTLEVVATAHDGLDALEKIAKLDPDVVTLDLLMPNLDGLGVLGALAGRERPRCVVVSTSDEQSSLAVQALQSGAVDVVHKPTALATDRLYEVSKELVDKVKIASLARPFSVAGRALPAAAARGHGGSAAAAGGVGIVVIGASTGGPQALTRLLGELPGDLPVPIAVVLHMPIGYTAAFAARLNESCAVAVVEARDGLPLRPGTVVIGRAGIHLKVAGGAGEAYAELDVAPLDTPHRPSVNVLFQSAVAVYGRRTLGAVMTGMGDDGLEGARAIRKAGGLVFTEAESSCVVYGMPRAVAEAGMSSRTVPLEAMADAIVKSL
ncbi:MAG: chemotaxis-specific protein-glutamate methyltransferase CheB [Myxococcales bacterium]|nr:chemotaxis-specific protein-glutamate methyltransferase CheB [Myxococcales bacterium]